MEHSIFRYVWNHSKLAQIWLFAVVIASMPFYFIALELPKRIVNDPIIGNAFSGGATTNYFSFTFALPQMLSGAVLLDFPGFEFSRGSLLFTLIGILSLMVCAEGLMKFYLNNYKGRLGERMLRRLRYQLFDRLLRFPSQHFKRTKASELSTIIKDEVEPLGGFIGDAFVQPFFLGSRALTALLFIMLQNFWLGLVAMFIVALQAIIIPQLRRKLITLGKQRQLAARALAGQIGETFDNISEIHVHDTSNFERARIVSQLGKIFLIRFRIYQRKFFIKFLNNYISQITPMLFYGIGGYLAITGRFDIGQLLAVIAAYKDLPGPIKEIIDWDQRRLDVQVKYETIIDQFNLDNLIPPERQTLSKTAPDSLKGTIEAAALTITDEAGTTLVEQVSFSLQSNKTYAFYGNTNSGADCCGEALICMLSPTNGKLTIDGNEINTIPEAFFGRDLIYVSNETALIDGSILDNIIYGLRNRPVQPYVPKPDEAAAIAKQHFEAYASGNPNLDIRDDWLDLSATNSNSIDELIEQIITALKIVELDRDIYRFGLFRTLDHNIDPIVPQRLLEARKALYHRLKGSELDGLIAPFDPDLYNSQASISENLLFGVATGPSLAPQNLAENAYFIHILDEAELTSILLELGQQFATTIVELSTDLAADHPFFNNLVFMTPDQISELKPLLARYNQDQPNPHKNADRYALLWLAFNYIESRHRMELVDDALQQQIVTARRNFAAQLPAELTDKIEFYDPKAYISNASVQDNILFGRIEHRIANAAARVEVMMREILDELSLDRDIFSIGLQHDVGTGGRSLNMAQRQKIGLTRALIKNPRMLIINHPLSSTEANACHNIMQRIQALRAKNKPEGGMIIVTARETIANLADTVLVFDAGRLVETGAPQHLAQTGAAYRNLAGLNNTN